MINKIDPTSQIPPIKSEEEINQSFNEKGLKVKALEEELQAYIETLFDEAEIIVLREDPAFFCAFEVKAPNRSFKCTYEHNGGITLCLQGEGRTQWCRDIKHLQATMIDVLAGKNLIDPFHVDRSKILHIV